MNRELAALLAGSASSVSKDNQRNDSTRLLSALSRAQDNWDQPSGRRMSRRNGPLGATKAPTPEALASPATERQTRPHMSTPTPSSELAELTALASTENGQSGAPKASTPELATPFATEGQELPPMSTSTPSSKLAESTALSSSPLSSVPSYLSNIEEPDRDVEPKKSTRALAVKHKWNQYLSQEVDLRAQQGTQPGSFAASKQTNERQVLSNIPLNDHHAQPAHLPGMDQSVEAASASLAFAGSTRRTSQRQRRVPEFFAPAQRDLLDSSSTADDGSVDDESAVDECTADESTEDEDSSPQTPTNQTVDYPNSLAGNTRKAANDDWQLWVHRHDMLDGAAGLAAERVLRSQSVPFHADSVLSTASWTQRNEDSALKRPRSALGLAEDEGGRGSRSKRACAGARTAGAEQPHKATQGPADNLPMPEAHAHPRIGLRIEDLVHPTDKDARITEASQAQPARNSQYASIPDESRKLADITRDLVSRISSSEKQAPVGKPSVWADSRQALCEALPYYRAYQGGGYCCDGVAYCFLVDKGSMGGDYMDSNVVIVRAGGNHGTDRSTGTLFQKHDQTENAQTKAVRNNIIQKMPIAIICGEQNSLAPCQMPHVYCVLDWFKPTLVWPERTNGKTVFRYRMEKLKPEEQSWWAPSGMNETDLGSLDAPITEKCCKCHKETPQIYLQGWRCLNQDCPNFWKFQNGSEPPAQLEYDPRFLKQRTVWPHSSAPMPLKPDLLSFSAVNSPGDDMSVAAWRGLVCPRCGRCTSRQSFVGWECGNSTCDFTYTVPRAMVRATDLRDCLRPLSTGYALSSDMFDSSLISMVPEFTNNYRINKFTIPGIQGCVIHLIANKTVNEEPNGPDAMFEELQTVDINLRRRPLSSAQLKGGMITHHFCVNYGMPYKFIAALDSHSFDGAAAAVRNARSRLNWASNSVIQEQHREFNEVLALAYFEKMAINYHDDGETGLGPTIATLSLGVTATMKMRMKAKHYHGITNAKNFNTVPPVPGCKKYDQRRAACEELQGLQGDAYRNRLGALPEELGLNSKGQAPDCIKMSLKHGDIVIMHGAEIQKYYEHSVEPTGRLRFALTCRYIDPNSLKPEDKPKYEVRPDDGSYDGSTLPQAD